MPSATAHAPPALRLPLRPYQEEAILAILAAQTRGVTRPLVVLPVGAGKTIVFAHLPPPAVVTRPCGAGLRPPAAGVAGDGSGGAASPGRSRAGRSPGGGGARRAGRPQAREPAGDGKGRLNFLYSSRQYEPLRPQFEAKGVLVYLAKEACKGACEVAIGAPK